MVSIRRLSILLFFVIGVAGCARMQVTVDVLDPQYVQEIQEDIVNARLVRQSRHADTSPVTLAVEKACAAWHQGRADIYSASISATEEYLKSAEAKGLIDKSISSNIKVGLAQSKTDLKAIADLIESQEYLSDCPGIPKSAEGAKSNASTEGAESEGSEENAESTERRESTATETLLELKDLFLEISCPNGNCRSAEQNIAIARYNFGLAAFQRHLENRTLDRIRRQISAYRTLPDNGSAERFESQLTSIFSRTRTLTNMALVDASGAGKGYLGRDGNTLALTDLAHAANAAPDHLWEEEYNIAEGFGAGGSTDMVIKLNGTADFSVKGLVFDARATATAARKITTSSIQLLASGAGMPIQADASDGAAGGDQQSKILDANDELLSAKASIAASERNKIMRDAALKRVAFAIISAAEKVETTELKGDAQATNRAALRETSKRIYETNRALITSNAQAGSE